MSRAVDLNTRHRSVTRSGQGKGFERRIITGNGLTSSGAAAAVEVTDAAAPAALGLAFPVARRDAAAQHNNTPRQPGIATEHRAQRARLRLFDEMGPGSRLILEDLKGHTQQVRSQLERDESLHENICWGAGEIQPSK